MGKREFFLIDVFAEEKFSGNQLAVFRSAGDFSSDLMQRIAKEMNFSETTFVMSDEPRDGGFDVRIFTPETELPFAGHPTLGTAYVIAGNPQRKTCRQPCFESERRKNSCFL